MNHKQTTPLSVVSLQRFGPVFTRPTLAFFLVLFTLSFSGCISNKKLVYLQDQAVSKSQDDETTKVMTKPTYNYIIKKGDILSVQINGLVTTPMEFLSTAPQRAAGSAGSGHPFLNGIAVNGEGAIDIPVIGSVQADGLTFEQLQKDITEKAKGYFLNPNVKVFLMNFYVTVLGEVKNPGNHLIYNQEPNMLNVIGQASGLTDFANRQSVKVVRQEGDKQRVFYLDLTDQTVLQSPDYYVHPQDIIYFKPMKIKKFTTNTIPWALPALSTVSVILTLIVTVNNTSN